MDPETSLDTSFSVPTEIPGSELGPALAKVAISLVILVGLMFATLWILRRLIQGRMQRSSPNQLIQIVERRPLSPKTMLYMISIEGEHHLIAESQLEVRFLKKIPKEPI